METTKLQEEYDLYIQDGEFRKHFQPLLTEDFLEWWFKQMPLPQEADISQREYFERMSWMLIGWRGHEKFNKEIYDE